MDALPEEVQQYVKALCLSAHKPAFFRVGRDGHLLDYGGDVSHYGIGPLEKGSSAYGALTFLDCLDPGHDPLHLPLVALRDDVYADVHVFPGNDGFCVVVLDAGERARAQQRIQQALNESLLQKGRAEKLLHQVRKDHEDLLSILDQLRIVTLVIDAGGLVQYISRSGVELLLKPLSALLQKPWNALIPLSEDDRRKVRTMMDTPAAERGRTRVFLDMPGGKRYWMEVDVQNDPRSPGGYILYLYDFTDVYDLRSLLGEESGFQGMIGKSKPMEQIFRLLGELARMEATVLIEGETGTGKELAARALHYASHRREGPFIIVNCAGLSDSLINSELFGHRKGSFTGAVQDQQGLFEAANGGTILLDEIGDVPMNTQTRLLRVLEEREIVRIGETQTRKIDIRILAATNKDLMEEVRCGRFRQDLLYRIRVARVSLPPLRKRREDIPPLVRTFLKRACVSTGKSVRSVDTEAMRTILGFHWPGNVRELRNAIEFAVIGSRGDVIRLGDLPPELREQPPPATPKKPYRQDDEKQRIMAALEKSGGNRGEAARMLGISRATLYRRMKACF